MPPDVELAYRPTSWGVMRSRVVGAPRDLAPEVVVVPGLAVANYLQPAVRELGAWTRAHLVELPGFSGSGEPPHPMDVPQLADALVQWLAASGLDRVVLAGHSCGTQVAARAAARRPPSVRALVLASPTIDPRFRSRRRVLLAWRRNDVLERRDLDQQHKPERQRAGWRRVAHALDVHLADALEDGVGELGDVQRVGRLAATREAGQFHQVRAGPGAELAHRRLEVVGHGEARDDDHLGDVVARRADDPAAYDPPRGGPVGEFDVR